MRNLQSTLALVTLTFHDFCSSTLPAQATSAALMEAAAAKQREQTASQMAASIHRQVVAVRRQITPASAAATASKSADPPPFFVMDPTLQTASDTPDCDPLSPLQIHSLAEKAGSSYRVSSNLIEAVIRQESGFRPCAVSPQGAQGLMQLMPDTATDLGVGDAFDPDQNVSGGAKFLRQLLDRYAGDLNRVLGAYNAGPARVDAYNGIPPFPETVTYVDRIMRNLNSSPIEPPTRP